MLRMLPKLGHSGSGLNFSFRSDSIYDCTDVGFDYTFKNAPEDISIHLLGVEVPDNCITGQAPAIENIEVPSQTGYYSIAIDIGEHIHNTGLLEVTDISYKVYLYSRFGMTMPYELMYKMPEGTIWGYVSNGNDYVPFEVLDTVEQTLNVSSDKSDFHEGYYGYFVYNPSIMGNVILLGTESNALARPFLYKYTGDPAELDSKVNATRDLLPAGMTLKLFTWQGEDF